jgi:hypothetical protein
LLLLLHGTIMPVKAEGAADVRLRPDAAQAWEAYVKWVGLRVDRELADPNGFLFEDSLLPAERDGIRRELAAGAVVIRSVPRERSVPPGQRFEVPEAELHHWWGAILVPGTTLARLLPFLQDYGHHAGKFADVQQSRLVSREGDRFRFFFRLCRSKAVVTACYNTEQECVYRRHGPTRVSSRSVAIRIAELENPGTAQEQEKPVGNDRGYLWRLVSWWRFEQTPAGVIVECESASLSRDIPAIIRWLPPVRAYIRSTPRESLESVLTSIRSHAPR